MELIIIAMMLAIGYTCGTFIEKRHYKRIKEREAALLKMPAIPSKLETCCSAEEISNIASATMVTGSVVLSEDYFKNFLASLKGFFGGHITAYESLVDRARREAVLRMKEQMPFADMIVNTRIETSTIGGDSLDQKKPTVSIEAISYGTAIMFKRQ